VPLVPRSTQNTYSNEEFVVSDTGDHLVRVVDPVTAVVEGRAYAAATVQLLTFDRQAGRYVTARTWPRGPFLLSPSGRRLVVLEGPRRQAVAYDLPAARPVEVDGLGDLFAAAGSAWADSPDPPPPRGVDEPPDYAGLTDQFDYGSADGGVIYAGFTYARATRQRQPIPRRLPPDEGQLPLLAQQVRQAGGRWTYLYDQVIDGEPRRLILDHAFRVVAHLPPQADRLGVDDWNAAEGIVLLRGDLPRFALTRVPFVIWRYGSAEPSVVQFHLDFEGPFRLEVDRFVLREAR
jgi:hypothetical protein